MKKVTLSKQKYTMVAKNSSFKLACWNFNQHIRQYGLTKTNVPYFSAAIMTIGKVIALSVLRKVYDPQRHGAENVSDSACKQEFQRMKIDIVHYKAIATLATEIQGEGVDILNTAIVALLDETKKYINDTNDIGYFDIVKTPLVKKELSKKVYIRLNDSKAYRYRRTTVLQECFRAVRRFIGDSKNMAILQNGYSYIDMYDTETLDIYYYRCNKYADIGGYDTNGAYTVSAKDVRDINDIISLLNLTDKQLQILKLRLSGYGYKAIATYLGITHNAVINTTKKIQAKWNKLNGINCKGLQG